MYFKTQIINKAMTVADAEVSQALPKDTRKVNVASRLGGKLQFAFVSGESDTTYVTIPAGSGGLWIEAVYLKDVTLYVQSDTALDTLELLILKD